MFRARTILVASTSLLVFPVSVVASRKHRTAGRANQPFERASVSTPEYELRNLYSGVEIWRYVGMDVSFTYIRPYFHP
jgi:uncharacterized membrane protein